MLKTNKDKLVEFYLESKPGNPFADKNIGVDYDGNPFQGPSIGGITLNIKAGDTAFGWAGDHIEPGVSVRWNGDKPFEGKNRALQLLACAGNEAEVMGGEAKGAKGVVMGHHGGSEHVIIEFDQKTKENLSYEDTIRIKAVGMGLKMDDFPEISIVNLAPSLLEKMGVKKDPDTGKLQVPVTTLVPSELMGSGIGSVQVSSGDYDIMTSCPSTVKQYNIDKIRFGDFVALLDQDDRFGMTHRKGAITIGIVIHSDCKNSGHGPGVTVLMSSGTGEIEPIIDPKANIADILGL